MGLHARLGRVCLWLIRAQHHNPARLPASSAKAVARGLAHMRAQVETARIPTFDTAVSEEEWAAAQQAAAEAEAQAAEQVRACWICIC